METAWMWSDKVRIPAYRVGLGVYGDGINRELQLALIVSYGLERFMLKTRRLAYT